MGPRERILDEEPSSRAAMYDVYDLAPRYRPSALLAAGASLSEDEGSERSQSLCRVASSRIFCSDETVLLPFVDADACWADCALLSREYSSSEWRELLSFDLRKTAPVDCTRGLLLERFFLMTTAERDSESLPEESLSARLRVDRDGPA